MIIQDAGGRNPSWPVLNIYKVKPYGSNTEAETLRYAKKLERRDPEFILRDTEALRRPKKRIGKAKLQYALSCRRGTEACPKKIGHKSDF